MNDIDGDRGEWAPHDLVLWGGGKRVDDWVKGPKAACRCSSVECAADTNWKLESDYNSPGVLIKTSYFPHNQSTSQAFLSFGVVSWIPAAFFFFSFLFWVTNWKLCVLHKFKSRPSAIFFCPCSVWKVCWAFLSFQWPQSLFSNKVTLVCECGRRVRLVLVKTTRLCCLKGERNNKNNNSADQPQFRFSNGTNQNNFL